MLDAIHALDEICQHFLSTFDTQPMFTHKPSYNTVGNQDTVTCATNSTVADED